MTGAKQDGISDGTILPYDYIIWSQEWQGVSQFLMGITMAWALG